MTLDDLQAQSQSQAQAQQDALIRAVMAHVEAALTPFRNSVQAHLLAAQDEALKTSLSAIQSRLDTLEALATDVITRLDQALSQARRDIDLARHDAAQSMVIHAMSRPVFQDALLDLLEERRAARANQESAP